MDKTILVTLTGEELADVIQRAVAAGMTQALQRVKEDTRAPTQLLTRRELSEHLKVTPHHISHLVKRGLPSLSCGADRRFRLSEVEAWLRLSPPQGGRLNEDREEVGAEQKNGHPPAEGAHRM